MNEKNYFTYDSTVDREAPLNVTYVICLPETQEARSAIVSGVRELVEKHGGEISGASNEDEMTVLDMIEQHEDFADYIADDARAKAKEVHAKAAN
ncbi:TPA: hypothetical protein NH684_001147 [Pseudomonas aeruginosa]|uniref:hypothetical protein n=1 Tax=Pseudomonas aeruginosa TaxID=287 RepID=UPI00156B35E3|nr:hypothetical protein [Pseudomonas aeruginosa]MBA5207905.1 hypothetical protein [Pseudomonas aeruginosa]MBG4574144.1 hypothetical protein [Pseudomonas aeruginosa]MBM9966580.1 hypothetical protein [Pseudomonas aeruginosa]MBN0096768.1 hypothetical protein [Pseudomonas aeruginosa]MBN0271993.1 hypothetical protein [Pseudomonas aeruginosa]